jgi:hypothetical protein
MDMNALPSTRRPDIDEREHKRRTGEIPLVIGAGRMLKGTDGKLRQYTAYPRDAVVAEAEREGRKLKIRILEFTTGRFFDSLEEMRAAFPDPVTMKLTGKIVLWAYWSEDSQDPKAAEKIAALDKEIAGRKRVIAELQKKLPTMEDVTEFDAATNKIAVQNKMLETNEAARSRLVESIIGLMSTTLHEKDLPPMPPQPLRAA